MDDDRATLYIIRRRYVTFEIVIIDEENFLHFVQISYILLKACFVLIFLCIIQTEIFNARWKRRRVEFLRKFGTCEGYWDLMEHLHRWKYWSSKVIRYKFCLLEKLSKIDVENFMLEVKLVGKQTEIFSTESSKFDQQFISKIIFVMHTI